VEVRDWLTEADAAAIAIVLAGCLLVWKLSTRWKHRFGTFRSTLIKAPAHRALFVLVLIGILLICMVPEAAYVLPVLDAVGLDIVTFLVALELRHYLASVARSMGIPTSVAVYLRVAAQVVNRCGDVLRMKPVLWLHACMWPLIWLRTWGLH
jgi:hypothetical protein